MPFQVRQNNKNSFNSFSELSQSVRCLFNYFFTSVCQHNMAKTAIPSINELLCQCTDLPIPGLSSLVDFGFPLLNLESIQIPPQQPVYLTDNKKKGPWTQEEDDLLLKAVSKYGTEKWGTVAKTIPGRAPNQCKERWFFRLAPDLKKTPFEDWEDSMIIALRSEFGNRWTLISAKLPGRSSCSVKNRWYTVLRKKIGKSQH